MYFDEDAIDASDVAAALYSHGIVEMRWLEMPVELRTKLSDVAHVLNEDVAKSDVIGRLDQELREVKEEIDDLEDDVAVLKKELESAEFELEAAEKRIDELEEQLTAALRAVKDLEKAS